MDLEAMSLEIITNVGTARSMYVEAVEAAKSGNIAQARSLLHDGEMIFVEGHKAHADLVNAEVGVKDLEFMFLVMHAEDQLMSAETLKIVCDQLVDMYEAAQK